MEHHIDGVKPIGEAFMRKGRLERSISAKFYDYQITGKHFAAMKKSFLEVVQMLQNEKKK